ncbi:MAG TPA: hypothetical protein PKA20_01505 [Burkholderiaceae bacterium]|nr:hypothetical protein [Burkholderiaceae bacterium]
MVEFGFPAVLKRKLSLAFIRLDSELRAWRALGVAPKLWWRDDDAHRDSAQLQQLRQLLAAETLLLAVVPGLLNDDLVRSLQGDRRVGVAQHGWKHLNHAAPGCHPSEYPASRERGQVEQELAAGQRILADAFPTNFHRVFVPPWHSCVPWVLQEAVNLGFDGVSVAAPPLPLQAHGYPGEANIEIDVSDWSRGGRFIGASRFSTSVVKALRVRRERSAFDVPLGILSHHACLSDEDFGCLRQFIEVMRKRGVRWERLGALFPRRERGSGEA